MKYFVALVLGVLTGLAAAAALLVFNPLSGNPDLSPLSVSDQALMTLNFSAVPGSSIVHTNDGESAVKPNPAKTLQLWEAPVRKTDATMTLLAGARGETVGLGIKYRSASEETNLLNGQAMADSVWHIVLPGRGTLFVRQSENYWDYLRDVVLPAYWSSSDSWKGSWTGNLTAGPGALGTAFVTGGSGEFAGASAEAVESVTAEAYSTRVGPVALQGRLAIEFDPLGDQALAAE